MKRPHPGRRLRNFLLDARLQLRYAGQMAAVSGGLTLALGWLIYRFNAEASRVVNVRAMDPADEEAQMLVAEFARSDRRIVLALVAFGVVLPLALAAWQIVTTHKIAGPLYYIGQRARRIAAGRLGVLHPLRKGDALQSFFEQFRAMHGALRSKAEEEARLFGELAAEAAGSGQSRLAERLRALEKERRDALE